MSGQLKREGWEIRGLMEAGRLQLFSVPLSRQQQQHPDKHSASGTQGDYVAMYWCQVVLLCVCVCVCVCWTASEHLGHVLLALQK